MELIDVLAPNELFHPKNFYEGTWFLGDNQFLNDISTDYLYLNAKQINGENAYGKFLEKYFYKPLENALDSKSMARSFAPRIVLGVDEETGTRNVLFSMQTFLVQSSFLLFDYQPFLEKLLSSDFDEKDTLEELKQLLREDRKKTRNVLELGNASPYFGLLLQDYLDTIRKLNQDLDFEAFLQQKISTLTKYIVGCKYFPAIFSRPVNEKELLEAFDYDTFCLVAAQCVMDICHETEEETNLLNYAIFYAKRYQMAVEVMRSFHPAYNASMVMLDPDSKKKRVIHIDDILKETDALMARHPEFTFAYSSDEDLRALLQAHGFAEEDAKNFDISVKENQEYVQNLFLKMRTDRELASEWEFIPKGKVQSKEESSTPQESFRSVLPEDEKIRRMVLGREFLENSPYLYKLYGMHKFDGYVAYLYANGAIIFEKYYENINTKRVSSSSATYVMNLYNFLEMSKLSKPEIIHLIHHDKSADVFRIYHRADMGRWMGEVKRAFTGSDYTPQVKSYIEDLISHSAIKKPEVII